MYKIKNMTFKKYVDKLNKFLAEHPEYGCLEALYAKDDEGNGYSNNIYEPSLGSWWKDGEFYSQGECEQEGYVINAVVIN